MQRLSRRAVALLLLVVGCLATVIANLAVWSDRELLDTDNFVATLAPLARDQVVIDGVAVELTDRMVKVAPRVPRDLVDEVLRTVLDTSEFQTIWTTALRRAHQELLRMADEGIDQIKLDLEDVLERADTRLERFGIDVLDDAGIERIDDIVPWDSPWLRRVLQGINLIARLAIILPPACLALFVGAVVLSDDRRRAIGRIGVGVGGGMILTTVGLWLARFYLMGRIGTPVTRHAAADVWDSLISTLRWQTALVGAVGAAVALGGWLVGRMTKAPA
ncbi:MAG TPA: hypothetical protein VGJ86_09405 [Acidimicrobiales bacterium]